MDCNTEIGTGHEAQVLKVNNNNNNIVYSLKPRCQKTVLNKIRSTEDHCLLGCTAMLDGQQYTNVQVEPAASSPRRQ
jgi:hypothetical protein